MDKEPSAVALLTFGVAAAAAAFLSGRYRPKWLWLVVPMVAFYFWAQFSELYDPIIGPAISAEAGPSYFQVSCVAASLPVLGLLLGLVLRRMALRSRDEV